METYLKTQTNKHTPNKPTWKDFVLIQELCNNTVNITSLERTKKFILWVPRNKNTGAVTELQTDSEGLSPPILVWWVPTKNSLLRNKNVFSIVRKGTVGWHSFFPPSFLSVSHLFCKAKSYAYSSPGTTARFFQEQRNYVPYRKNKYTHYETTWKVKYRTGKDPLRMKVVV